MSYKSLWLVSRQVNKQNVILYYVMIDTGQSRQNLIFSSCSIYCFLLFDSFYIYVLYLCTCSVFITAICDVQPLRCTACSVNQSIARVQVTVTRSTKGQPTVSVDISCCDRDISTSWCCVTDSSKTLIVISPTSSYSWHLVTSFDAPKVRRKSKWIFLHMHVWVY